MGFLISFVKNDEIRFRIERGKKSTQFLKGSTRVLFLRILKTKMRELEKHSLTFFQVPIHSDLLCLWPEALIDSFIALG